MAKRLQIEQIALSDRRGSTAHTARIASSSQQSWRPTKSEPRQRASMATSHHRGGIGEPDGVPTPGGCGFRNEDVHHREVSNAMERTKPEFGETIPVGSYETVS